MALADLRAIADIAPLIRRATLSPVELVRECLARIQARASDNAFITVLADDSLAAAERAARDIAEGRYRGPLHGIPISVKDLVDVAGVPTTSGSRVPPRLPAADATVVQRLRHAGVIVVGKTNLHEFAFGTTSDESAFGPVRNPRDPERSAGGSSGGSAAALAAGVGFGSIGTDTGGSIRIPAAACGIVGLKPTLGELPCDGVVPLSTMFDHVGPMARSVSDVAMLFQAMKGMPVHEIAPAGGELTFAVPRPYFCERLDSGTRAVFESSVTRLRQRGHTLCDVEIEHARTTPDVYLHICLPEASSYHARQLESAPDDYSPGVRLRLEMGRYVLAEDYVRAVQLRGVLIAAVDRALDRYDALLLPTMPIGAPPLGATAVDVDGVQAPVRATMLSLTQLFNITGHPAIALPAGDGPDALPRSVQLVGRRGRTDRLLEIAAVVEKTVHHP
jgi:aspartyl-tRNA(Asn)/glutamyl-tRNA(Gln) amidotransferase subunit A